MADPQPVSANQPYRLALTALVNPPSGAIGLILKTRVDGGPPLRLLLDSGAEHLVLSRSAAYKSGHRSGAELDLIGAGASARIAQLTTAGSVEIGALAFRECPMVIVEGRVAQGIDGVIPLSLFANFLIRLDVPRRLLELEPYQPERQTPDPTFFRATKHQHLLFLQSHVKKAHDGYMLLDTGSSYNVIDNAATAALPQARALARSLPVIGASGNTEGRLLPGRLAFQFGGRELVFDPVVAMDLAQISRRHGIEVFGIIGYPALAGAVVTVNYRESLVRIQAK